MDPSPSTACAATARRPPPPWPPDPADRRKCYGWSFAIDAASYLAVLICLLLMRPAELHRRPPEPRSRGAVREGLRYLRSVPVLRISFVMLAAAQPPARSISTLTRGWAGSERSLTVRVRVRASSGGAGRKSS